jgi:hypothetical protein
VASGGSRGAIIGTGIVVVLAGGWFVMSSVVMRTSVIDALGQAIGVAFGLLMVVSVVGAIVTKRGE